MAKRTNRVAWGLGLAVVLAAGGWFGRSAFRTPTPEEFRQSLHRDFKRNLKEREVVVALARAGELAPAGPGADQHFKKLPFRYRHLSDGGEVYVVQPSGNTTVQFYTFRGLMTGGWSAFFYVADDSVPFQGDHQEKMAPHWYWVTGD